MAKSSSRLVPISTMAKFGDALGKSLRTNLQWSTKLRRSVKVHKVVENGTVISITVTVGEGNQHLTGMARAFELGSGLHGKRMRKYKIQGNPRLAFFGTNGYGNAFGAFNPISRKGVGAKNIVVVPSVMHPGVEARPFLRKSLTTILPRLTEQLRLDVKKQVIEQIRVVAKEIK